LLELLGDVLKAKQQRLVELLRHRTGKKA